MKNSRNILLAVLSASLFLVLPTSAPAGEKAKHVIELFTSQGCYSCPPADKLLGEIASDYADVVALEFHVDYWDNLVYGSAGKWQDPFSSAEYSARQRAYTSLPVKGREGVYTPQMIVDGRYAFVGSQQATAKKQLRKRSAMILDVSARLSESGEVQIDVDGDHAGSADIWLVTYDLKHVTDVPSGENKGKRMANFNVVRNLESVGRWSGSALSLGANAEAALGDNQHCAVIVQKYDHRMKRIAGPIIGAAKCSIS